MGPNGDFLNYYELKKNFVAHRKLSDLELLTENYKKTHWNLEIPNTKRLTPTLKKLQEIIQLVIFHVDERITGFDDYSFWNA